MVTKVKVDVAYTTWEKPTAEIKHGDGEEIVVLGGHAPRGPQTTSVGVPVPGTGADGMVLYARIMRPRAKR